MTFVIIPKEMCPPWVRDRQISRYTTQRELGYRVYLVGSGRGKGGAGEGGGGEERKQS